MCTHLHPSMECNPHKAPATLGCLADPRRADQCSCRTHCPLPQSVSCGAFKPVMQSALHPCPCYWWGATLCQAALSQPPPALPARPPPPHTHPRLPPHPPPHSCAMSWARSDEPDRLAKGGNRRARRAAARCATGPNEVTRFEVMPGRWGCGWGLQALPPSLGPARSE